MKFTWTENDIICGRVVCKPLLDETRFEATGFTAKWTFKIGFVVGSTYEKDHSGVVLISMTDGMVGMLKSKQQIADDLNADEMIPMPHKWLIETINYLRDRYEGV